MPRRALEFRVVIASPSDLYETRKAAFEVIQELDQTFEAQSISIRGLGWEEYATPGIGREVQEVVGEQILREYDILIALFATKLGSPTEKHASGTVEEIEHAIANTSNPMGHHRVQVYFKDRIESVSGIPIDEFVKLFEFRKQLGARGVLYGVFNDNNELQKQLRINIRRPILEYLKSHGSHSPPFQEALRASDDSGGHEAPARQEDIDRGIDSDEFGMLDLAEKGEKALELSVQSINHIAELMNEISNETNRQAVEIENRLTSHSSASEKKAFINHFAEFLKLKAGALEQQAMQARSNFGLFAGSLIAIAAIQKDDGNPERYKSEQTTLLDSAETFLNVVVEARTSIRGYRTAVASIPRITIQFNQAKKLLLQAIDECQALFDEVERRIFEITAKT